jgi:hypothetical protein
VESISTPVDGFTVRHTDAGLVVLCLSSRYGDSDEYEFLPVDAARIARALLRHAEPPA